MIVDFLCNARTREDMELLAKQEGFMDEEGNMVPGADLDPSPGSPAYEGGMPIQPPEELAGAEILEWHFNLRLSGALGAEQIEGIPQYDDKDGSLLPLRQRTKFGIAMSDRGMPWTGINGVTTGVTNFGVTFIDPESIASQQRVWQ